MRFLLTGSAWKLLKSSLLSSSHCHFQHAESGVSAMRKSLPVCSKVSTSSASRNFAISFTSAATLKHWVKLDGEGDETRARFLLAGKNEDILIVKTKLRYSELFATEKMERIGKLVAPLGQPPLKPEEMAFITNHLGQRVLVSKVHADFQEAMRKQGIEVIMAFTAIPFDTPDSNMDQVKKNALAKSVDDAIKIVQAKEEAKK
jgi:hypothetical protein